MQAKDLVPGSIIFHQPRNHHYQVLFKTMVKLESGKWEYGWCYQEVKMVQQVHDEMVFEQDTTSEIYTRPFSLFDDDWKLPQ